MSDTHMAKNKTFHTNATNLLLQIQFKQKLIKFNERSL